MELTKQPEELIHDIIDYYLDRSGHYGFKVAKTQSYCAPALMEWLKDNAGQVQEEMQKEMKRYLPILERLEAEPELWIRFTEGTGIATANGYRNAIKKGQL